MSNPYDRVAIWEHYKDNPSARVRKIDELFMRMDKEGDSYPTTCWMIDTKRDNEAPLTSIPSGEIVPISRVVMALLRGENIQNHMVNHRCESFCEDHYRCARPEHLYLGSAKDNARDCILADNHPTISRAEYLAKQE